jgi:hypothetical protein
MTACRIGRPGETHPRPTRIATGSIPTQRRHCRRAALPPRCPISSADTCKTNRRLLRTVPRDIPAAGTLIRANCAEGQIRDEHINGEQLVGTLVLKRPINPCARLQLPPTNLFTTHHKLYTGEAGTPSR